MDIDMTDDQGSEADDPSTPKPTHSKRVTEDEVAEIVAAVSLMDEKQQGIVSQIIIKDCPQYGDRTYSDVSVDDLPNNVLIVLLEHVRSIFGNPNDRLNTTRRSNSAFIDLTDETQNHKFKNVSNVSDDGVMKGVSHVTFPSQWMMAPLAPLRDEPADLEGASIEFIARGRTFNVCANQLPKGYPNKDALLHQKSSRVELSQNVRTARCYFNSLVHQNLWLEWPGVRQQDFQHLIELYSFGEHMNDPNYLDYIMEAFRVRLYSPVNMQPDFLPDTERILAVFSSTKQDSKLRLLMVDLYIVFSGIGCYPTTFAKPYGEFVTLFGQHFTEYSEDLQKARRIRDALLNSWPWPYYHTVDGIEGNKYVKKGKGKAR